MAQVLAMLTDTPSMLKRLAMRRCVLAVIAGCLCPALAGCDLLGIESPEKVAAVREAEGRAVGGACRHAGRAIEDCYAMNRRADKAAVFAGWREMNDYMRENKMEAVTPELTGQTTTKATSVPAESERKSGERTEAPREKNGSN